MASSIAGGGFDFRAFDAETGEILWQVQIQYGGQASPTIAGDFVLVTSQQGWLYALDRDTGRNGLADSNRRSGVWLGRRGG